MPLDSLVERTTTLYGGKIDRSSISDYDKGKKVSFTSYGHSKEFEELPFWEVSEEYGNLRNISGVTLLSYTNPPDRKVSYGPKKLEYKFPNGDPLSEISIRSAESSIGGMRWVYFDQETLKFAYDKGDWTTLTIDTYAQTLYSENSLDNISVDLGKYPKTSAATLLSLIKEEITSGSERERMDEGRIPQSRIFNIQDKGIATLKFDDGDLIECRDFFQSIVFFDGTDYNNKTNSFVRQSPVGITLLEDSSDYLYIGDTNIFSRITWALIDVLTAGTNVTVEYGKSFSVWETLTLSTDTTNELQQDGYWKWNLPQDWHPTSIETAGDALVVANKYWLRISIDDSDTLSVVNLTKNIILRGKYADILEVNVDGFRLSSEEREDTIIIRRRSANDTTSVPAVMYNGIVPYGLIKLIATRMGYNSSRRTIGNLRYTLINREIVNYGMFPFLGYCKKTGCVKYIDAISTLFAGVGNELWKMEDTKGYWEKVGILPLPAEHCLILYINYISSSGKIAVVGYSNHAAGGPSIVSGINYEATTFAGALTDSTRSSFESTYRKQRSEAMFTWLIRPGRACSRQGRFDTPYNTIGSNSFTSVDTGEQISLMYQQSVNCSGLNSSVIYDAEDWEVPDLSGAGRFYFWNSDPGTGFAWGSYYLDCPPGYFGILDNSTGGDAGDLQFKWSYGQQDFIGWSVGDNRWIVDKWDRFTPGFFALEQMSADTGSFKTPTWSNPGGGDWNWLAICAYKYDYTFLASHVQWYDYGEVGENSNISYAYISRILLYKASDTNFPAPSEFQVDKAYLYDATGDDYTDITSDLNAGTSTASLDENHDAIYIANDCNVVASHNRFFSLLIKPGEGGSGTPDYVVEYWNGSAWADISGVTDGALEDGTSDLSVEGYMTWRIPRDWTEYTLADAGDGTDRLWIRIIIDDPPFLGSAPIAGVIIAAETIWESRYYAPYRGCLPISLAYDTVKDWFYMVCADRDSLLWKIGVSDITSTYINPIEIDGVDLSDRCLRGMAYYETTGKLYAVLCDLKHKYYPIELIEIDYDGGTSEWRNTSLGVISSDYNINDSPLTTSTSKGVFGVTRSGKVFNYTNDVYPFISATGESINIDCKEATGYICQMVNAWWYIKAKKYLVVADRLTNPSNTKTLVNKHLYAIEPTEQYEHFYDGIQISWIDLESNDRDQVQFGAFERAKRILTIENPFVQYRYIAEYMKRTIGRFVVKSRRCRVARGIYLIQLEQGDGIIIILPNRYSDINDTDNWILTNYNINLKTKEVTMNLIQNLEV